MSFLRTKPRTETPETTPETDPETSPETDPADTTFLSSLIFGDYLFESTTDNSFFETRPNFKKYDILTSEEASSYDMPKKQVIN